MLSDKILDACRWAAIREMRRRNRAQQEIIEMMLEVIRETRPEVAEAIEKLLEVANE